jgi:hypothetical protein
MSALSRQQTLWRGVGDVRYNPRLCCKSLFALVIKNSPGFRRGLHVKMWGTSSATDKLTGDLGNVIGAAQTGVRRSDRLTARKSSLGNFGLLQHNHPQKQTSTRARRACSAGSAFFRACCNFDRTCGRLQKSGCWGYGSRREYCRRERRVTSATLWTDP